MEKIVLSSAKAFEGFINVAGNSQDTSTEDHNKAVMNFIEMYNAGTLKIEAFTGNDGKIILEILEI